MDRKLLNLEEVKLNKGNRAVFLCARNVLRGKIIEKEEGNLREIFRQDNSKEIISFCSFFRKRRQ